MNPSLIFDETSCIFPIINSKIGRLRDSVYAEIDKIELWITGLRNQTKKESKIRKEICEICYSREISFDGHHLAGRKHDHRQITVCKSCHRWLSDNQKTWDKRWEQKNLSDNLKLAFFLLGLQQVLILKSRKTGTSLYENFGYSLTEEISELLKRG